MIYVRSKFQISEDSPQATGARSTYDECAAEFGHMWPKMLEEIDDKGAAVLPNAAHHKWCHSASCTQVHAPLGS